MASRSVPTRASARAVGSVTLGILFASLVAAAAPLCVEASGIDEDALQLLGHMGGYGSLAIDLADGLVYVGIGPTLRILDVADPARPVTLGRMLFSAFPRHVIVRSSRAYVALDGLGLQVVDVTEPRRPVQVGAYDPGPADIEALWVEGTIAYVGVGAELRMLDMIDPASPRLLGTWTSPIDVRDVEVADGKAYVTSGGDLRIVDVRNPTSPRELGAYTTLFIIASAVAIDGPTAYFAAGPWGLRVIDVTDPVHPRELGGIETVGDAAEVVVRGTTAFVGTGDRLDIVDVSERERPRRLSSTYSYGGADALAADRWAVYMSSDEGGLRVFDVRDPVAPRDLPSSSEQWRVGSMAVDGSRLFVVGQVVGRNYGLAHGLAVLDSPNPAAPSEVLVYRQRWWPKDVAVQGDTVYLAAGEWGLRVLDLRDPARPVEQPEVPGWVDKVVVSGAMAYALARTEGGASLLILDLADPQHPVQLGTQALPREAWDVDVAGQTVYVPAGIRGLRIIDVDDPRRPREIAEVNTGGLASFVAVQGTMAYVAAGEAGLAVIDVSDPAHPLVRASLDLERSVSTIAVAATTVLVGSHEDVIFVVDATDPSRPRTVSSFDMPFGVTHLVAVGRTLFAGSWTGGLYALRIPWLGNRRAQLYMPLLANGPALAADRLGR